MKICLINPYIDIAPEYYSEHMTILPPLGLGYLAAVLIEDGHQVEIIDCISACPLPVDRTPAGLVRMGQGNEEVLRRVRESRPEVIGISCSYTAHAPQSYEIARLVKDGYSREVPVIAGGAHSSNSPSEVLAEAGIDYVVKGEGERTLSEFCAALAAGSPVEDIPGLLYMGEDGQVAGNQERQRITDLDSLPFPRRDLFPLSHYSERQLADPKDINNRRIPKTTVLTSRGCPGNCVFCASRCMWGRKWIARSPENIIEEIEHLVRDFGIREIDFLDDNISVSEERLTRICELIMERGIDIKWTTPNGIAIWTLNHDLLRLMKKSGCYRLVFGLETGDPDTRDFVRKKYRVEHVRDIIGYANKLGMWTVATFIIGFPYENEANIRNTMEFASSLGLDIAMFYSVTPYPSTDLYEVCRKEGIDTTLSPERREFDTLYLGAAEVRCFREAATEGFIKHLVRRPWKLLEKIKSWDDLKFTARVARHSLGMVLPRPHSGRLGRYPNFKR